ncbi:MAG: YraN family protein [Lachnospiraceae bacterium]|nr:YraN family protein [Lachnospiraceae bacterium]
MGQLSEDLGREAEEKAGRYLESCGYTILERRFRCRFGDIDLIFRDGDQVVFAEVKYRKDRRFGDPAEYIGAKKIGNLRLCARAWQCVKGTEDMPCRFDVLALVKEEGRWLCRHIRDAF